MDTEFDLKSIINLNDLNWAYRAARVLHVANQLDIFTKLAEKPMTSEKICLLCHTKPILTEKLLIACTSLGLLEKKNDLYQNSQLAQDYLVRGNPFYQGNIIAHSANVWDVWTNFADEIYLEPQKSKQDTDHENFIMGMHNIAVTGRAQLFIDNVDLTDRMNMLDVGGGPATYSIYACKKYPKLKSTIFDLPETIEIAQKMIKKENLQDRITTQHGDWNEDEFGQGKDVVLLSDVMHGPDSGADMKLRKAFNSMVAGGLLVIQEFLLNDDKTGPLVPALFNVMVGAFSKQELTDAVKNAGFEYIKIVTSNEEIGASWITAIKP